MIDNMADEEQIVLMSQQRIHRSLKRIAYQIVEQNRQEKEILIAGINQRGYAVAQTLADYLSASSELDLKCVQLRTENEKKPLSDSIDSNTDYFIVLADDVIFTGRTMFTALSRLSEEISLYEVHTVTLIDRGHRQLPIKAEFTGMELSTKLNEHVSVEVGQDMKLQKVLLYKP